MATRVAHKVWERVGGVARAAVATLSQAERMAALADLGCAPPYALLAPEIVAAMAAGAPAEDALREAAHALGLESGAASRAVGLESGAGAQLIARLSRRDGRAAADRALSSDGGLAAALAEPLKVWSDAAAGRGAPIDGAAVLLLRPPANAALATGLRAVDPETGFDAPAHRASALDDDALAAAHSVLASLEDAFGEALEIDAAVHAQKDGANPDSSPRVAVLALRPLRAASRAIVETAVGRALAGRITRDAALRAVPASRLEEMLHPTIADDAPRTRVASGISASPGAAAGRLCFTADATADLARDGEAAILVRTETAPEDVHGMDAAVAVVTSRGGLTSHAAVIARGLGLPCVVGAADARVDVDARRLTAADGRVLVEGDWATVDGSRGELLLDRLETRAPEPSGAFATLMVWADARRRMAVRANADTAQEVATAFSLGVDGVGLCRTEHMFFEPERIVAMRRMIFAETEADRRSALEKLLPMQRADFQELFRIVARGASGGPGSAAAPITIRLLDPPLHEFLPQSPSGLAALAEALGQPVEDVTKRARDLREFNPMLGKRGCRVGVAFPEIYETQARAVFEAALNVEAETGQAHRPEIMIPLVSAVRELALLRARIDAVAAAVSAERGAALSYRVGIMVETPRAALRADALGAHSEFFSFGTNDLTQMTYGLSRDDAGRLMRDYVERGVFETDPFQTLDEDGVGELIRLGVARGRAANPELQIGLCGEHGGSPRTIDFCERAGFDYVSCSPYRTPIARLAAAQAAIARDAAARCAESADEQ